MNTFTLITAIVLLAGPALSHSVAEEYDNTFIITEKFFPDSLVVYTAEHDITKILVPTNRLNFDDNKDENLEDEIADPYVFFVEADKNVNGEEINQGLFVLKDGKVKKLLEDGQDIASGNDSSKMVFFGAKDGIYTYNVENNTAEKYGTLTDDIIGIEKEDETDVIYILTKDNHVYKVTNEGKVKTELNAIQNAKQIVLDDENNLYFYTDEKKISVWNSNDLKEIKGLPEHPASIDLVRPSFLIHEAIPVIIDNKLYVVYANGTSEITGFQLSVKPTASSMEMALIQYHALNKKMYKYNVSDIVEMISVTLRAFFETFKKEIEAAVAQYKDRVEQLNSNKTMQLPN